MKKWARLSPEEVQKRIVALETLYGQKNLASMLGVHRDSVKRYSQGKTFPAKKEIYNKINFLYNKNKSKLNPEKIETLKKKKEKRTKAQLEGRIKTRYASIYPEYLDLLDEQGLTGTEGLDELLDMSESGFVVAWRGRAAVPLEVQFMAEGEGTSLKRFGKVVHTVYVTVAWNSPKWGEFKEERTVLNIGSDYYRNMGLKKEMDFDTRIEKIRDYLFNKIAPKMSGGEVIAFLGFYFDEGDDI